MFLCCIYIFCCILFISSETVVEKEGHPAKTLVKTQTSTDEVSSKTVTSVDNETQITCDKGDEKAVNDSENKSDSGVSVDTQSDTKELEGDQDASVDRAETIKDNTESSVIERTRSKESDKKLTIETPSISLPKTDDSKDNDELEKSGAVISPISPISPHSPQLFFEEDPMPGKFIINTCIFHCYPLRKSEGYSFGVVHASVRPFRPSALFVCPEPYGQI